MKLGLWVIVICTTFILCVLSDELGREKFRRGKRKQNSSRRRHFIIKCCGGQICSAQFARSTSTTRTSRNAQTLSTEELADKENNLTENIPDEGDGKISAAPSNVEQVIGNDVSTILMTTKNSLINGAKVSLTVADTLTRTSPNGESVVRVTTSPTKIGNVETVSYNTGADVRSKSATDGTSKAVQNWETTAKSVYTDSTTNIPISQSKSEPSTSLPSGSKPQNANSDLSSVSTTTTLQYTNSNSLGLSTSSDVRTSSISKNILETSAETSTSKASSKIVSVSLVDTSSSPIASGTSAAGTKASGTSTASAMSSGTSTSSSMSSGTSTPNSYVSGTSTPSSIVSVISTPSSTVSRTAISSSMVSGTFTTSSMVSVSFSPTSMVFSSSTYSSMASGTPTPLASGTSIPSSMVSGTSTASSMVFGTSTLNSASSQQSSTQMGVTSQSTNAGTTTVLAGTTTLPTSETQTTTVDVLSSTTAILTTSERMSAESTTEGTTTTTEPGTTTLAYIDKCITFECKPPCSCNSTDLVMTSTGVAAANDLSAKWKLVCGTNRIFTYPKVIDNTAGDWDGVQTPILVDSMCCGFCMSESATQTGRRRKKRAAATPIFGAMDINQVNVFFRANITKMEYEIEYREGDLSSIFNDFPLTMTIATLKEALVSALYSYTIFTQMTPGTYYDITDKKMPSFPILNKIKQCGALKITSDFTECLASAPKTMGSISISHPYPNITGFDPCATPISYKCSPATVAPAPCVVTCPPEPSCNVDTSMVSNGFYTVPSSHGVVSESCGRTMFVRGGPDTYIYSDTAAMCCKLGMKVIAIDTDDDLNCMTDLSKTLSGAMTFWTTLVGCHDFWYQCDSKLRFKANFSSVTMDAIVTSGRFGQLCRGLVIAHQTMGNIYSLDYVEVALRVKKVLCEKK